MPEQWNTVQPSVKLVAMIDSGGTTPSPILLPASPPSWNGGIAGSLVHEGTVAGECSPTAVVQGQNLVKVYVSVENLSAFCIRIPERFCEKDVIRHSVYVALRSFSDLSADEVRVKKIITFRPKDGQGVVEKLAVCERFVAKAEKTREFGNSNQNDSASGCTEVGSKSDSIRTDDAVGELVIDRSAGSAKVLRGSFSRLVRHSLKHPYSNEARALFRYLDAMGKKMTDVIAEIDRVWDNVELLLDEVTVDEQKILEEYRKSSTRDMKGLPMLDLPYHLSETVPKCRRTILRFMSEWLTAARLIYAPLQAAATADLLFGLCERVWTGMSKVCQADLDGAVAWYDLPDNKTDPWAEWVSSQESLGASGNKTTTNPATVVVMDPADLASEITRIDERYYNRIGWPELLDQCWTKPKKQHLCPNLMRWIGFFNRLSSFVQLSILQSSTGGDNSLVANHGQEEKLRLDRILVWMRCAGCLLALRNYSAVVAVVAGLNSAAVYRLRGYFQKMDGGAVQEFEDIQRLMSHEKNYKSYRDTVKKNAEQNLSCIPYPGVFLRDLVFAEDGQPTMVDGLINIGKFMNLMGVTEDLLRFQGKFLSDSLTPESARGSLARMCILQWPIPPEQQLFELSYQILPRNSGGIKNSNSKNQATSKKNKS